MIPTVVFMCATFHRLHRVQRLVSISPVSLYLQDANWRPRSIAGCNVLGHGQHGIRSGLPVALTALANRKSAITGSRR